MEEDFEPESVVINSSSAFSLTSTNAMELKTFLLKGDRKQALEHAVESKLWPEALILASSIDGSAWKETCRKFVESEFSNGNGLSSLKFTFNFLSGVSNGSFLASPLVIPF